MACVWDDGSYDSDDDKQTGSSGQCSAAGGTWMDKGAASSLNGGQDWSSKPDQYTADAANSVQATVTPPTAGTNLAYDVEVAEDTRYFQAKQPESAPTPDQYIRAIALAAPTICGGGVFGYLTREGEVGPVSAAGGAYGEYDSRSRGTVGVIGEVGGGQGMLGGVGAISTSQGTTGLAYGGFGIKTPIVSASAGGVGFTTGVGGYVEGGVFGRVVGGGAYANITTNAGCMAKK